MFVHTNKREIFTNKTKFPADTWINEHKGYSYRTLILYIHISQLCFGNIRFFFTVKCSIERGMNNYPLVYSAFSPEFTFPSCCRAQTAIGWIFNALTLLKYLKIFWNNWKSIWMAHMVAQREHHLQNPYINQNHMNLISKNALFSAACILTDILNAEHWIFKVRIFCCRIIESGQCCLGPSLNNLYSNHVHGSILVILRFIARIWKFPNSKNVDWRGRIFIKFLPQLNICCTPMGKTFGSSNYFGIYLGIIHEMSN